MTSANSTFHAKNLRSIIRIHWPQTISNQQLLERCEQESMETIIMRRRQRWIGHVMRREQGEQGNIAYTALHCTPEGRWKRGRPKNTWRRTVEGELKILGHILYVPCNNNISSSFDSSVMVSRFNALALLRKLLQRKKIVKI